MVISVDKVLKIIEHYGEKHQRYKCAEELSELQTIILQDANQNGKVPKNRVIEEIADVYVTLKQIEIIYGVDDRDIQPVVDYKIERTIERAKYE